MARKRVDTQFVIILAVVLTLAAGSVAGAYLYFRWQNNDPAYLQKKAETALAKGDTAQAIQYYGLAAYKAKDTKVRLHNYLQYAQLSMKTAEGSLGARNYREALKGWSGALDTDPANVESGDALMRELFAMARTTLDLVSQPPFDDKLNLSSDPTRSYIPLLSFWGAKANAVATARPDCGTARALRGWWNVRRLMELNNWVKAPEEDLKAIREDYEAAIKSAPDEAAGYLVACDFELRRADLIGVDKMVQRRKAQEEAIKQLETYLTRHPDDLDVLTDWIYLRMWFGATKEQLEELNKRAIEADAKAKADPANPRANPRLASIIWMIAMRQGRQPDAEPYLKAAVDMNPSHNLARWRLAMYYEGGNKWEEEVKILDSLKDPANTGKKLDALLNDELRGIAMEELPRINLLIAYREKSAGGLTTGKGKTAMEAAQTQIKVLQGKNPQDVWVAILEGRRSFLEGNFSALDQLRSADERTGQNERSQTPRTRWRNFRTSKLYLAEAYAARHDDTKAIEKYTELLEATKSGGRPDDVYARLQLAELYKNTKQWPQMIREYERLHQTLGDEPSLVERWADGLMKSGNPEAAENLIRTRGPANKRDLSWVIRGVKELMDGHLEKAMAAADQVLAKDPTSAEARFLKARVLRAMNENDRAAKLLSELVQEFPAREEYRKLYLVITMPEASDAEIQAKLIESMPDEQRKAKTRIGVYWTSGKYDEALQAINQAETKWPDDPDLIDLKFRCLLIKKDFNEAARYATKAKGMNLDQAGGLLFEGQLDMARAGNDMQKRERALQKIGDAARTAKDYYAVHAALGDAYMGLRRFDEAMKEYEETIRLKSDSTRELKLMVQLLMTKRSELDTQRAREYLRRALQVSPNDRELRAFEDEIGDLEKVIARREEQNRRFKDDLENAQRLARLYVRRSAQARNADERASDIAAALKLVDHVVEKSPGLMTAHWAAGLYRDAGQQDKAIDQYQPYLRAEDPKIKDAARLAMGRMYRSMNRPEDAVRVYTLLSQSPAAPKPAAGEIYAALEARKELADMLFELERMPDAEAAYRGIESVEGKSARVTLRLCETLLNQGKFAEADNRLAELAAEDPSNLEATSLRGFSWLLQKKLPEASAKFAEVLTKDRDNVNALHFRAVAEFSRPGGDIKQALEDLQRIKEILRARGTPNGKIESRLLLARIYRMLRRYPEAVREYREISDLDHVGENTNLSAIRSEYTEYLAQLADNVRALPPDVRGFPWMDDLRAIRPADTLAETLQKLMTIPPKLPLWPQRYGELMLAEGRAADAIPVLKQAAADAPENRVLVGLHLNSLVHAKRWNEAVTAASAMIAKWPDMAEPYALRAAATYGRSPKAPEVKADIEKAIELTPDLLAAFVRARQIAVDTNAALVVSVVESRLSRESSQLGFRFALAAVYMMEDRTAEVAEKLKPALDEPAMALKENIPAKSLVLRTLGDVSMRSRKFGDAMSYYEKVLALDPNNIEALNNMAYVLAEELGKPAEALPHAQRAVSIMRQRPVQSPLAAQGSLLDTYAWVLYRVAEKAPADDANAKAQLDEARKALEQARDVEPAPLIYLHLAQTYEKLAMLDEARRAGDQGLKLARAKQDPIERQIQHVIDRLRNKK